LVPKSSAPRVIQEGGQESEDEDDLSLDQLLVKAQEAGARSRRAKYIQEQLEKGLEILHSQGEEIDCNCDEISALNLTEEELKTLLRNYKKNPQKISISGPSNAQPNNRLRLMDDLKRLSGNISAADARDFQSISDKIGKEDIEMNLLVDEEAIFSITSTLEAIIYEEVHRKILTWIF
jgi:hypothetical protein